MNSFNQLTLKLNLVLILETIYRYMVRLETFLKMDYQPSSNDITNTINEFKEVVIELGIQTYQVKIEINSLDVPRMVYHYNDENDQ